MSLTFLENVSTTEVLVLTVVFLLLVLYLYSTSYHGVWEKVGVPGPKPLPFIDHLLEIRDGGMDAATERWFKKYGKTFGAYGLQPHVASLVTKDLSLIKQVLVKDFDNFVNRYRPFEINGSFNKGLSSSKSNTWRRQRHVTNSSFTGAKMKMMMEHVNASAKTLTELAKQHAKEGKIIPVKDFANKYSCEVIARVGFGVTTHEVTNTESEFAYHSRNLVRFDSPYREALLLLSRFFPHLCTVLRACFNKLDFINKESDSYFISILKSAIQERKNEKAKSGTNSRNVQDILDLLMEAEVSKDDPRLKDNNSKTLDQEEVIGNSTIMILAGVETVSTTFQSILYCLALHPDVQDKIVAEVDSVVPKGAPVDYDHLAQLKYTEQVINECLRLFPLLVNLFRITNATKTYDGITIPKGTVVQIPISKIMKDPEHWEDPEKFDPDRFSPEKKGNRDPVTFMPFGFGPRICLGQRLAIMELKVIIANLLREMKFILTDKTEPKKGEAMKMKNNNGFVQRHSKPVCVEGVLRE